MSIPKYVDRLKQQLKMKLSNYVLPLKVKEQMAREYLSGIKTFQMLRKEYGMNRDAISKIRDKFLPDFTQKP